MRFIDTNLFLRYLTKDDEEKAQAVLELLKKVKINKEKVTTSPLVVFEIIFTLQNYYKVPRKEIQKLLIPILNLRGLKLDYKMIFEKALAMYAKSSISFADIFNYCFMMENKIEEIYSFDKDFDKLENIKRIIPS